MSAAARAIRSRGAVANVQLCHHGELYCFGGTPPIGPMARVNWDGIQVVKMNEDMIEEVIEDFANTRFAKQTGST